MSTAIAARDFDFKGNKIRCLGTDRDPWFVAKDVAEAVGLVWKGNDTLAHIPDKWKGVRSFRTPMRQRDGTSRDTHVEMVCINEPALYMFVLRSSKPEAVAFTEWVASEVLPSIRRTGQYATKRAKKYLRAGKSEEWVERRQEGVETRREFTTVLGAHGVAGVGYANCTDAINVPVLGGTSSLLKMRRGIKPRASLRDGLSTSELISVQFAESLAARRIEADQLQGNAPCVEACRLSGQAVATAIRTVAEGAVETTASTSLIALPPPASAAGEDADFPDTCFTPAIRHRRV